MYRSLDTARRGLRVLGEILRREREGGPAAHEQVVIPVNVASSYVTASAGGSSDAGSESAAGVPPHPMGSSDVVSAAQAGMALRSLIRTSVPYMSLSIKSTTISSGSAQTAPKKPGSMSRGVS